MHDAKRLTAPCLASVMLIACKTPDGRMVVDGMTAMVQCPIRVGQAAPLESLNSRLAGVAAELSRLDRNGTSPPLIQLTGEACVEIFTSRPHRDH